MDYKSAIDLLAMEHMVIKALTIWMNGPLSQHKRGQTPHKNDVFLMHSAQKPTLKKAVFTR